jgi:hypothetical protein
MGMYDYFLCDVSCPVCGNTVRNDFQTKDFENMMDTYRPGDNVGITHLPTSIRTYTTCDHAREITKIEDELVFTTIRGVWIEYEIPIIDGIISEDMNTWKRKIEPTMYNALSVIPENAPRDNTKEWVIDLVNQSNAKIQRDILITKWEQTHIGKAPIR